MSLQFDNAPIPKIQGILDSFKHYESFWNLRFNFQNRVQEILQSHFTQFSIEEQFTLSDTVLKVLTLITENERNVLSHRRNRNSEPAFRGHPAVQRTHHCGADPEEPMSLGQTVGPNQESVGQPEWVSF